MARWLGRNWARLSYARMVEPFWLETNHIDIRIPGLDPRLEGLTVCQLSDLHLCRAVPASHLRQAIDRTLRLKPDLIALTGDYVHAGFHYVDAVAQLVGQLRAPLGVFAVLGNHDYSIRVYGGKPRFPRLKEAVESALTQHGIEVLRNEHRLRTYQGATLAVAGVCDLWSGEADLPKAIRGISPDVPRIVLAHHPRTVDQAAGKRCDLILSGHTHGGQVELGEGPWSRFKPQLGSGLFYHDSGYLYVHKGIGYTLRFRFRVRPEIAIFRLSRWDKSDKLEVL
ncbi:metallophosphoesterase [bacterium]|nr:metallophosphoesterase [bacterium]